MTKNKQQRITEQSHRRRLSNVNKDGEFSGHPLHASARYAEWEQTEHLM